MRSDHVIREVFGEEAAVTPNDLCEKQFSSVPMGYSKAQVDDYLEYLAEVFDRLIHEIGALKEIRAQQEAELSQYQETEQSLRDALSAAQRSSEQVIDAAKREANALVEEARLTRQRAQLDAAQLPAKLMQDIRMLEHQRGRLRSEMLALLETHRSLVETLIPDESAARLRSFFDLVEGNKNNAGPDPESRAEGYFEPFEPTGGEEAAQESGAEASGGANPTARETNKRASDSSPPSTEDSHVPEDDT